MSPAAWLPPSTLALIDLALDEDLGRGDVTTAAVIPPDLQADGAIVAREALTLAGLSVAAAVLRRVDAGTELVFHYEDGDDVSADSKVLSFTGSAARLLAAERTALNFLQRLSGIATLTRAYVAAIPGSSVRIADTRKTYPGARHLEKEAVRAGGGTNHRFDLGSGVLIKDNHIAVAGSVTAAVERARRVAPHGMKVEVEVDTLSQLDEALAAGADIILLDNFARPDIEEAVVRAQKKTPRPLLEVSGGVTLARLPQLAATGVDIISIGALTHSARAVDLSMELVCR